MDVHVRPEGHLLRSATRVDGMRYQGDEDQEGRVRLVQIRIRLPRSIQNGQRL